ncbi:hypothetical protein QBC35DRAFT_479074 [Podospora australis]|uniref:Infection structure specific protein n=1 Tax=Podospora australis TaxID=1536484 RepID=A0AAN7ABE4_9PEZI|nr:hypothetical protein QBC35DRAFT_479074 [Podospora australis]
MHHTHTLLRLSLAAGSASLVVAAPDPIAAIITPAATLLLAPRQPDDRTVTDQALRDRCSSSRRSLQCDIPILSEAVFFERPGYKSKSYGTNDLWKIMDEQCKDLFNEPTSLPADGAAAYSSFWAEWDRWAKSISPSAHQYASRCSNTDPLGVDGMLFAVAQNFAECTEAGKIGLAAMGIKQTATSTVTSTATGDVGDSGDGGQASVTSTSTAGAARETRYAAGIVAVAGIVGVLSLCKDARTLCFWCIVVV